eukprot:365492-Chlamydomonas_euryale.AAC.17
MSSSLNAHRQPPPLPLANTCRFLPLLPLPPQLPHAPHPLQPPVAALNVVLARGVLEVERQQRIIVLWRGHVERAMCRVRSVGSVDGAARDWRGKGWDQTPGW